MVAFYGSTPNYAFIFDQLGFEGTTEKLRTAQRAGDLAGMAKVISDDLLAHFVVQGTWDELPQRIADRCKPLTVPPYGHLPPGIGSLLAKQPRFRFKLICLHDASPRQR